MLNMRVNKVTTELCIINNKKIKNAVLNWQRGFGASALLSVSVLFYSLPRSMQILPQFCCSETPRHTTRWQSPSDTQNVRRDLTSSFFFNA
jgi:hypothetical protein